MSEREMAREGKTVSGDRGDTDGSVGHGDAHGDDHEDAHEDAHAHGDANVNANVDEDVHDVHGELGDVLGPVVETFTCPPSVLRGDARLRLIAAVIAIGAVGLSLLGALPVPAFLIALTGALVSLFWISSGRRGLSAAHDVERFTLSLHAHGLLLGKTPENQPVLFQDVSEIEVDEERLEVVVRRHDGNALRIEPRYPGVEIHELMHRLRNAWLNASDK